MSDSQSVAASCLWGGSEELGKGFWQQWQQYRDYLHRCCIKWMGGNPIDAEDALSRAMLKAWARFPSGRSANANAGETVRLSVVVEEVESVVGSSSIEEVRSGEACCPWQSVQHSESDSVAATSEGKLEVKRDGSWCVEAALCERQPAPILALAQFDAETGRWGNSCLAVFLMQQQPLVGKVAGEFLLPSRSPPLYRIPYFQSLVKSLSGMIVLPYLWWKSLVLRKLEMGNWESKILTSQAFDRNHHFYL